MSTTAAWATGQTDPVPTPLARIGWAFLLALRFGLAFFLFVYGWTKVFLMQMGVADYGDALVTFGEMSPMGLLWRFMAYSPAVQLLSGLAEVVAGGLLLWRRTAGVGALLGAADMAVVFGLNVAYDVPVKQLSLMLTLGCAAVAMPYAGRYLRALFSRGPIPAGPWPTIVDGKPGRLFGVVGLVTAIALTVASGAVFWATMGSKRPRAATNPLVGVHRVSTDTARPAPQLADDARWQQLAFGQYEGSHGWRFSVRQANGDLRLGSYRVTGPSTVRIDLKPVQRGAVRVNEPTVETVELQFGEAPGGGIRLVGPGQDLTITPDPEHRFLFDRDFSWAPRTPVNR